MEKKKKAPQRDTNIYSNKIMLCLKLNYKEQE